MAFNLNFNLDTINQSAVLLFQCNGAGITGGTGAYIFYNNYYICPMCYEFTVSDNDVPIALVTNTPTTVPNTNSLFNLPKGSDVDVITQNGSGGNTWISLPNPTITTNENFTLWCHMYNLNHQQINEPTLQLNLFPVYQTTLNNLMSKYLESLQYNNITVTDAMLISQSKMFSLMNVSSNKKCNSSLNNALHQNNTRILLDDAYDYTLVSYNNNAAIQTTNTKQFVLTKTLLRFLELLNLSLINPIYNLDWFEYSDLDSEMTITQDLNSSNPQEIDVTTNITLPNNENIVGLETYYINNKSTSCIISFLTLFGTLQ